MLGVLFFVVALLYASVGFGGGSSYLALLVLWQVPYAIIPAIALICNIVVVAGNSVHYARAGYINWRLLLPITLASIPAAYFGGSLHIAKDIFVIILFVGLLATGVRLLIQHRRYDDNLYSYKTIPLWLGIILGATLGILAGITGIGGGIFLAPVLYHLRAGSPKQIAAAASIFILLNSISGILGQLQKSSFTDDILSYWYLPIMALIGGQIGNLFAIKFASARTISILTAILILFVTGQLGMKILEG